MKIELQESQEEFLHDILDKSLKNPCTYPSANFKFNPYSNSFSVQSVQQTSGEILDEIHGSISEGILRKPTEETTKMSYKRIFKEFPMNSL